MCYIVRLCYTPIEEVLHVSKQRNSSSQYRPVRVPLHLDDELQRISRETNVSISALINLAIAEFLERLKEGGREEG